MSISLILLAGGKGVRMSSSLPKQYHVLHGKPIACHSLERFLNVDDISQFIVVCDEVFCGYFSNYRVQFAKPGPRRQDSLFNGLQIVENKWVCIHDAVRPFITSDLISILIEEGKTEGAAALATPVKNTLKESDALGFVSKTLERNCIWEIQTPQFLNKKVLEQGFAYANAHHLTVTDDVSLAELIGIQVKLVPSSYQNIKITTPEDLILCQNISLPSAMMEQSM